MTIMYSKYLILLITNSYLCLASELMISNCGKTEIPEGDLLEVSCTGSEEIDIFYPKNDYYTFTSPAELITSTTKNKFKLTLKRPKAVHGDTGWYGCAKASENFRKLNLRDISITPFIYSEIDIKWTYVFVKSENKTLVSDHSVYFLQGEFGKDVVIPCRPTSPKYKVKLSIYNSEPTEYFCLGDKISYNETIGFTIHNINAKDAKTYACNVRPNGDKLAARVKVKVPDAESGLFSTSETLHLTSYPPKQMSVGDNYQLNCTIYGNNNLTENLFQWLTPRQGKQKTRFIIEPGTYATSYSSELTIENVTNDDVGEYKCHFYGFSILRLIKVNLKLHTKRYLYISESLSNQYKQMIGQEIKWKVNVAAYPLPTFKWLDPKGREIENDWSFRNYKINGERFSIVLLKSNLTIEDGGDYTLIVTNSEETKTLTFFLDILMEPIIKKRTQEEVPKYKKNTELEFICEAEGYPLPTITWTYSNSFDSSSSATVKNGILNGLVTPIDIKKVTSTIKLNAQRTGKLTCKACNHLGCDSYVVATINIPGIITLAPEVTSNFETISLSEGDPLSIICLSSEPTIFFYPVSDPESRKKSFETITGPILVDQSYQNIFERQQTIYTDSGWYGCANTTQKYERSFQNYYSITPDIYDDIGIKWIYVFVKSSNHLFVDIPFVNYEFFGYMLKVNVGDDITIPCRPTSLEYQVELSTKGNKLQPNNSLSYDPRKGFTIKNFQRDSPKLYDCIINSTGSEQPKISQMFFNVFLSDTWDPLETPKITTNLLTHMELGKDFSLNCTVPQIYQSSGSFVNWFTPKPRNKFKTKLFREITFEIFHTAILELTIENVTLEDIGEYECYAYEYPVARSENINLTLHNENHLEMSIEGFNNSYSEDFGKDFILTVNVDAYPLPKFTWLNPTGQEIDNNWNFHDYQVNGEQFSITLAKYHLSLNDTGDYTLIADNSVLKKNLTFYLEVTGLPNIIGKKGTNGIYSLNQQIDLKCEARGYPLPNIEWSYLNKYDKPIEGLKNYNAFPEENTVSNTTNISSYIAINSSNSGSITCRACNIHGCKTAKLYSVTVLGDTNKGTEYFKSVQISMAADVGETVQLNCSIPIDRLSHNFEWFNDTVPLTSNEEIVIDETSSLQSHSSLLTIANVKKWHQGVYSCRGKTVDDFVVKNQYYLTVNASAAFSTSVILQLSIISIIFLM